VDKAYRVREFAELAGVTVRTLHHYERIGLLRPKRTDAGYRLYSLHDLGRLEQIVALKFLGVPLKQIKVLLEGDALGLPEALRLQLTILEDRRQLLDRAIGVIRDVVTAIQSGRPAEAEAIKTIIGAIKMQNNADFRKKYFTKESWVKFTKLKEQATPLSRLRQSQAWITLLGDVEAARKGSPAGKKAQSLAERWMELAELSSQGDPGIKAGWMKAWQDRQHWPASHQEHFASYNLEKIVEFIGKALAWPLKKYYTEDAWAKLRELQRRPAQARGRGLQARVELYRDVQASLKEDPGSEKARILATRWTKLLEIDSGGDPGIKAGVMKAFGDRRNWPNWLKRQMASTHQLSFESFDQVVEFLQKAVANARRT
jgi:MerR family transcriptional regulator, thiopeptide resistance regulator